MRGSNPQRLTRALGILPDLFVAAGHEGSDFHAPPHRWLSRLLVHSKGREGVAKAFLSPHITSRVNARSISQDMTVGCQITQANVTPCKLIASTRRRNKGSGNMADFDPRLTRDEPQN